MIPEKLGMLYPDLSVWISILITFSAELTYAFNIKFISWVEYFRISKVWGWGLGVTGVVGGCGEEGGRGCEFSCGKHH